MNETRIKLTAEEQENATEMIAAQIRERFAIYSNAAKVTTDISRTHIMQVIVEFDEHLTTSETNDVLEVLATAEKLAHVAVGISTSRDKPRVYIDVFPSKYVEVKTE